MSDQRERKKAGLKIGEEAKITIAVPEEDKEKVETLRKEVEKQTTSKLVLK